MNADELRSFLQQRSVDFEERDVTNATQFRCQPGGEIFNVFTTGKLSVQGKVSDLSNEIKSWAGLATPVAQTRVVTTPAAKVTVQQSKPIFIVYGHDLESRNALELQLRRFDLEPIILQNVAGRGNTIIELLEQYIGDSASVGYACVLLTPDDEGHRAGAQEEKKYRARQNVILELGMVIAKLGRPNVAILHKESVELPSDISGYIYIPYVERIDEVKEMLFKELQAAGYAPNPAGL